MTFREKIKKLTKSSSANGDSGNNSSKQKGLPNPTEHPLANREDIREKSKPYHDILGKFNFGRDDRRKSSAGNVSPMGSRRGSMISFRRLSRDASARDSSEKPRKTTEGSMPARKPHSGDPKALETIQSVAEPHDDEEQEPKINLNLPTTAQAVPTEPAIAELAEPLPSSAMTDKRETVLAEPEFAAGCDSMATEKPTSLIHNEAVKAKETLAAPEVAAA